MGQPILQQDKFNVNFNLINRFENVEVSVGVGDSYYQTSLD